MPVIPALGSWKPGVQHPLAKSRFEATLGYKRPCQNQSKAKTHTEERREGAEEKIQLLRVLTALTEQPGFSQHPQGSLQTAVTPVPGESHACFWSPQATPGTASKLCTNVHTGKTPIQQDHTLFSTHKMSQIKVYKGRFIGKPLSGGFTGPKGGRGEGRESMCMVQERKCREGERGYMGKSC